MLNGLHPTILILLRFTLLVFLLNRYTSLFPRKGGEETDIWGMRRPCGGLHSPPPYTSNFGYYSPPPMSGEGLGVIMTITYRLDYASQNIKTFFDKLM